MVYELTNHVLFSYLDSSFAPHLVWINIKQIQMMCACIELNIHICISFPMYLSIWSPEINKRNGFWSCTCASFRTWEPVTWFHNHQFQSQDTNKQDLHALIKYAIWCYVSSSKMASTWDSGVCVRERDRKRARCCFEFDQC